MLHPQQIANRRLMKARSNKTGSYTTINITNNNNTTNNKTKTNTQEHSKQKKSSILTNCFKEMKTQEEKNAENTEPGINNKRKKKPFSWTDKKVKDPPVTVSVVEYYEDKIGGETVIINKHHLYTTDNNEDITIVIRDYLTPDNFTKTDIYYRQINKARQTYLRAAIVAGDCLKHRQDQEDQVEWQEYLNRAEEEKKLWRQKCRNSDSVRDKEIRIIEEDVGCFDSCKRIWRKIWKSCLTEFIDIFPCCFGE